MISSTGCDNDKACQESVIDVIHSNRADYDRGRINESSTPVNFSSVIYIFECLCTACTAKSDVSLDTLRIFRIVNV